MALQEAGNCHSAPGGKDPASRLPLPVLFNPQSLRLPSRPGPASTGALLLIQPQGESAFSLVGVLFSLKQFQYSFLLPHSLTHTFQSSPRKPALRSEHQEFAEPTQFPGQPPLRHFPGGQLCLSQTQGLRRDCSLSWVLFPSLPGSPGHLPWLPRVSLPIMAPGASLELWGRGEHWGTPAVGIGPRQVD